MKHFVLFASLMISVLAAVSQTIYQTATSGNYSVDATWVGGAAGKPPAIATSPTPCDCKIVVNPGHVLIVDQDLSLTNAVLLIKGQFTPSGSPRTIILDGTSAIDVRSTGLITSDAASQTITLDGDEVWNSTFSFQSGTPGTVQGPASVLTGNTEWQSASLPVKLTSFTAARDAKGVSLSWKTSAEENSSYFDIERSVDGKNFSSIGTVTAAGNTSTDQSYSFSDAAPADGENYYRLKIVDIDAKSEYSPIRSVGFSATALNVVVGPNPATSFVNIKVSAPGNEPYRLRLINRSGQVVFDQKYAAASSRVQVTVSNYADGTYFVEVSNNAGLRQVNKVMVVRR